MRATHLDIPDAIYARCSAELIDTRGPSKCVDTTFIVGVLVQAHTYNTSFSKLRSKTCVTSIIANSAHMLHERKPKPYSRDDWFRSYLDQTASMAYCGLMACELLDLQHWCIKER